MTTKPEESSAAICQCRFGGVIDMATVAPQFPRERIVHWDDPRALAEAGPAMSGRDFLDAVLRGALPSPPICHLVDFTFERIDDGRVEMVLTQQESQYNPIGSVHGGIIATSSIRPWAAPSTPSSLSDGRTRRWRSKLTTSGASIARPGRCRRSAGLST